MIEFKEYIKNLNKRLHNYIPDPATFTPGEEGVFKPLDLYNHPKKEADEYKFKAIKYAFKHHYENNSFYKKYCKENNVTPDDIKSIDDFNKIPLIPDKFFKTYPSGKEFAMWLATTYTGELPNIVIKRTDDHDAIINKFNDAGLVISYSSGTSGRHTFIPRDKRTFNDTEYAIAKAAITMIYPFWEYDSYGYLLMPNPFKTNVFAGKVCSVYFDAIKDVQVALDRELKADLIRAAMKNNLKGRIIRYAMQRENKKMMERIINWLRENYKNKNKISFIGAPFILYFVMEELERNGESFDFGENGAVITGGGWKIFEGQRIPVEEFRKKVEKILGIPPENCLDLYGMVEGNGWMIHCPEGHYLHIPSTYYHAMVIDENGEEVAYGEKGRFAFLDGLAMSYPSFIISGDEVRMYEECPVCHRSSPVLEPEVSRAKGDEMRGCAEEMRRVLSMDLGGKDA
ncbi:MAG: hypothetical protein DRN29_00315 [Thermoplasmata archaeon]|nr:MAG: hypothetical protein DRN29_00315 [Thermoplasmata archaeon]